MVIIRNFRADDVVAYVRLVNEIDEKDRLGKATSLEHMRERLGQPHCHPEQNVFLAEENGLLVGYAEIQCELEIWRVILDGAVHPAHRYRSVGSSLLETAIEHSRKLGTLVAHIPVAEIMTSSRSFVEKRGFALVRHYRHMGLTSYKRAALPAIHGYEVRHFTCGDEEGLCVLQNLAFADSWGFRPNTTEEIHYLVNTSLCHPEGIPVVTEGQKMVAYCWTIDDAVDSKKAYVRMIGVDPAYRNRGLGRIVLVTGIEYLMERGMKKIELMVDSENASAQCLYQSLGFKQKGILLWYEKRLSPR